MEYGNGDAWQVLGAALLQVLTPEESSASTFSILAGVAVGAILLVGVLRYLAVRKRRRDD